MYHIAFICDDAYAMPTMVAIHSIIDSVQQIEITVHVCSFALSVENIRCFKSLSKGNIFVTVEIFSKEMLADKLAKVSQRTHVTTTALLKLELPNFFPQIDKLLYLDSDVVVKGDLSYLLSLELNDNMYLAATFDYWIHFNAIRYKWKRNIRDDFYFNSGVMYLNLRMMRMHNIVEKLWDYKLTKAKTTLMDQECFNEVCKNHVFPISVKWNFNPVFFSKENLRDINRVYNENYDNLEKLLADVRIIHYVGKTDKPWVYSTARLNDYWLKEFEKTNLNYQLNLIDYQYQRKNPFIASIEKIKEHGFLGYISFVRYTLEKKYTNKIKEIK